MMGRRRGHAVRGIVVGCLAALVLAGCTETPAVTRYSTSPDTPSAPAAAPPPDTGTAQLAAAKKAAGIADCPASDAGVAPVAAGLPDAVLPCLGGGRSIRLAGLRGKPMVINVWAQWCGPCRQEAPFLSEFAASKPAAVLVLGVDHDDTRPELAIEFARVAAWTYPQLSDPKLVLRSQLQVAAMPQTFFVRADGTIAHRQLKPFASTAEIRSLAQQYLGVSS